MRCQHCGALERPDDPVLECWVDNEQYPLHRGCQDYFLKAMEALPASSKVLGKAPAGHCCELCGKGRHVYRIQLPGEEEAAERHKNCAGRYWAKMREPPPDSCVRHSWMRDYSDHIGSAKWERFRREVIEQRGNRCEQCGREGGSLMLHHLHYKTLGNERPEDVQLLCRGCHEHADEKRDEAQRIAARRRWYAPKL